MAENSPRRKRSKAEIKTFFDWQRAYRERIFQHPETKRNWRLFALGYFLSDKFGWADYSCFYGRERLAAELGVDVRTVTNLTKQLARMGFIRIKRQGRERPSLYIGTMPSDVQSDAHQEVKSNAHRTSDKDASMCNSVSPDVKYDDSSMCNGFHPNDSSERILEHKGAAKAAPPEDHNGENNLSSGDGLEGRPPTGGKENIPVDDINLKFAEALEAAASGIEVDPFIHVLSALPLPETDDLAGFAPEAAGSVELDDDGGGDADDTRRSVRELIELCNARDDDLCAADSLFVARLEERAVSDLTADDIARLERIVAILRASDRDDLADCDDEYFAASYDERMEECQ